MCSLSSVQIRSQNPGILLRSQKYNSLVNSDLDLSQRPQKGMGGWVTKK